MATLRPGGILDARLETLPEAARREARGARLAATVRLAAAHAPRGLASTPRRSALSTTSPGSR